MIRHPYFTDDALWHVEAVFCDDQQKAVNAAGNIAGAAFCQRPLSGRHGRRDLKTIHKLAAAALFATFGLASAAVAYSVHHPVPHHRHCTTHFVHGHRVTHCM